MTSLAAPACGCAPAAPQRGSNYDEKRVQRLQRALDVAAQHLAKGVPPPVQGTSVFPPGARPVFACRLGGRHGVMHCLLQPAAGALRRQRPMRINGRPPPAGNEDGLCIGEGPPPRGAVAAVVVVTFNRCAVACCCCKFVQL